MIVTNEDPLNAQEEEAGGCHSITNEEEVVVAYTRENRGGSAQHATRATQMEEAVFIRASISKEDPSNAHQEGSVFCKNNKEL